MLGFITLYFKDNCYVFETNQASINYLKNGNVHSFDRESSLKRALDVFGKMSETSATYPSLLFQD